MHRWQKAKHQYTIKEKKTNLKNDAMKSFQRCNVNKFFHRIQSSYLTQNITIDRIPIKSYFDKLIRF